MYTFSDKKIYISLAVNPTRLDIIDNTKFTPREIDVLACFYSGKAVKATASFLSTVSLKAIVEKTVAAHDHNIKQKLACNNRTKLLEFIEKSGKAYLIRKHYQQLCLERAFKKLIQEFSLLIPPQEHIFCRIYREREEEAELMKAFTTHLMLAGITVELIKKEEKYAPNGFTQPEREPKHSVIYIVSNSLFEQLQTDNLKQRQESPQGDQTLSSSISPFIVISFLRRGACEEESSAGHLTFHESYYFTFFEILKAFAPHINITEKITQLQKQYEIIFGCASQPFVAEGVEVSELKQPNCPAILETVAPLNKGRINLLSRRALLVSLLFIALISLKKDKESFENSKDDILRISAVHSDLPIPVESVLLKRPKIMAEIEEKLKGQKGIGVVAIVGIGGSGKTTLARQYARNQKASIIWEINAKTNESLINSLETLSYTLCTTEEEKNSLRGLQQIKNPLERAQKLLLFVRQKLKCYKNWFLIFDNVESFTDLQTYFPYNAEVWGEGKIIITSRDSNIRNNIHIGNAINIEPLSEEEKFELFSKILDSRSSAQLNNAPQEQVKSFVNAIPPFPLDISIAAYYMKATNIPYKRYLEHVRLYKEDFVNIQEDVLKEASEYTQTRYNIIALSLNNLIDTNRDFRDLLLFISLLEARNIPRDLLDHYKNSLVVDSFFYNLKKYSLITDESFSFLHSIPTVSLHRSTQQISLAYLTKTLNLSADHQLLSSMADGLEKYITDAIDKEDFYKMELIVDHSKAFLSHHSLLPCEISDTISARLGGIYYHLNCYSKAEQSLEKALKNLRAHSPKRELKIAWSLAYLGSVSRELGKYHKAKDLLEESLTIYKKHFPRDHIQVAWVATCVGNAHRKLGNYEIAQALLEQSLITYKKYLPKDHLRTAWALLSLGNIYRELGKYDKARDLIEQSLLIYKKHFAEDHLKFAWASACLGNVYLKLGKYETAKSLLERSLVPYKKYCPEIVFLWMLVDLGNVYGELGDYKRARDIIEYSLTAYKKNFPADHITVAWASACLANVHRKLGNQDVAKTLLEQSLIIYKKNFAEEHVKVARIYICLGNIYRNLSEYEKAKSFLHKGYQIYEKAYGKAHIETAKVMRDLGKFYLLQDHTTIAENFIRKSLEIFEKNGHPELYTAIESLADLYLHTFKNLSNKGKLSPSQDFKQKAIACLRQALEFTKVHFPENSSHIFRLQAKVKLSESEINMQIRH